MSMSFEECWRIASLMDGFNRPWFIAGGWAIDLYLGEETRKHEDLEISIFRKDQGALKSYLHQWEIKNAVQGQLLSWNGEFLEQPVHELHATHKTEGSAMEILLNESDAGQWRFRRDERISAPLHSINQWTQGGIPYLSPEIVLLYKTKQTREKDDQDFLMVRDCLAEEKRNWLQEALVLHQPGHKWLPI